MNFKLIFTIYPTFPILVTDRINDLDASPLMSLLDDLGGWPVLNPEWDESGFDYIDLMAKLKLYGTSALLSQWVGVDDRNSSSYIIHVNIVVQSL